MSEVKLKRPMRLVSDEDTEQLHMCSICKKLEAWNATWQWYGSYVDLDNTKPIVRTCSQECRDTPKAKRLTKKLSEAS